MQRDLSPQEVVERWRTPEGVRVRQALLESFAKGQDWWHLLKGFVVEPYDKMFEMGVEVDLRGIDLRGIDMRALNCKPVDQLYFCWMDYAILDGCNLNGGILQGAWLNHASLRGAKLSNVSFGGARGYNAVFDGSDLSTTWVDFFDLRNASFVGANMRDCHFSVYKPFEVDLRNADLTNADFYNIKSPKCLIDGAILTGATIGFPKDEEVSLEKFPERLRGLG